MRVFLLIYSDKPTHIYLINTPPFCVPVLLWAILLCKFLSFRLLVCRFIARKIIFGILHKTKVDSYRTLLNFDQLDTYYFIFLRDRFIGLIIIRVKFYIKKGECFYSLFWMAE